MDDRTYIEAIQRYGRIINGKEHVFIQVVHEGRKFSGMIKEVPEKLSEKKLVK